MKDFKDLFTNKKVLALLVAKKVIMLAILFFCSSSAVAQGLTDVRINEFLVHNVDSYEDDYGHKVGWIELFNQGYSQVDVGGAFFKVRGKEYRIPKNDPRTKMPPQGYLVFFAEGTASKGTFHANFMLDQTDYITLYDQSGKVLVDSVHYDRAAMKADISVGWYDDHDGNSHFGELSATTPYATNDTEEKILRSEIFRQADPSGGVMAMTAMAVVFSALLMLCFVFKGTGNMFIRLAKRREERNRRRAENLNKGVVVEKRGNVSHEEMAAIAVALYRYSENIHDIENTVLTINRVARAYSPWSSKIYSLRQTPIKK